MPRIWKPEDCYETSFAKSVIDAVRTGQPVPPEGLWENLDDTQKGYYTNLATTWNTTGCCG